MQLIFSLMRNKVGNMRRRAPVIQINSREETGEGVDYFESGISYEGCSYFSFQVPSRPQCLLRSRTDLEFVFLCLKQLSSLTNSGIYC